MAILRVKVRWTGFNGAPGYNVFHFGNWASPEMSNAQGSVDALTTFYMALRTYHPSVIRWDIDPAVEVLDEATGELRSYLQTTPPATIAALGTGNWSAPTGYVINWLTETVRRGRRVRGRTFMVPMAASAMAPDGTLDSSALTAINNAATSLAMNSGSSLAVYGRPTKDQADGVYADVTSVRVADKAAVLRSRRD